MTYQDLTKAINVGPRDPGGCTPPVVDVVDAGGEDVRLLVNAVQGWETKHGRKAGLGDEAEALTRRDQLRVSIKNLYQAEQNQWLACIKAWFCSALKPGN